MKRTLIILLLLVPLLGQAAPPQGPRHLVRAGWGDMLFEKMAFFPSQNSCDYRYIGHFFADYHYSLTRVVSVGGQVDFGSVCWTQEDQNAGGDVYTHRSRNYDLSILPTVRFTYLNTEWVRLYSGVGAGLLLTWDNASNCELAPVFNLNFLGVQVGKGHWSGSLDLGMLNSMKNIHRIYMLGSRLISVGVNYRW